MNITVTISVSSTTQLDSTSRQVGDIVHPIPAVRADHHNPSFQSVVKPRSVPFCERFAGENQGRAVFRQGRSRSTGSPYGSVSTDSILTRSCGAWWQRMGPDQGGGCWWHSGSIRKGQTGATGQPGPAGIAGGG